MLSTLIFTAALFIETAYCRSFVNVTVDDRDKNAGLSWNAKAAAWNRWDTSGDSKYFFQHSLISSYDSDAKAWFNFTGNAVYYYAPLWPKVSTVMLCLDDPSEESCETVKLQDDSQVQNDWASQMSGIRWGKTGLENGLHSLTIKPGNTLVLDGFMYTTDDPPATYSATTTSSISTFTSAASSTTISSSSSSPSSSSMPKVSLIGAIVGTAASLLLLSLLAFLFFTGRLCKCCGTRTKQTTQASLVPTPFTASKPAGSRRTTTEEYKTDRRGSLESYGSVFKLPA